MRKVILFNLILILTTGCIVKYSNTSFYEKKGKIFYKYLMVKDKDFVIDINVEDSLIDVNIFTSKTPNIFIKSRNVDLKIKYIGLQFYNTKDTLIEIDNKNRYFSCVNFKEKITKNNQLILKFDYSIDSTGVIKDYTRVYNLYKKTYTNHMIRVH